MFRILIIILLISKFVSASDEAIRIYVPGYKTDTIDYGMRYDSNDVIAKRFYIENNTSKTYYIGVAAPTFATYQGPSGNETHGGFEKRADDDRVIKVLPGETEYRDILFSPFDLGESQQQFKIGMWDAFLLIGLSTNPDNISNPDFVDYSKIFVLKGRVSDQDFDIWDKEVKFDSVFASSPSEEVKEINFRNNSETRNINLTEVELNVLTSEPASPEFVLEELSLPIDLEPRSSDPGNDQESIQIRYSPVNRGIDSSLVEFKADIGGDSFTSSATISGTGVVQELSIDDCSENYFKEGEDYIIDLGDVGRQETKVLSGTIKNTGNLNFHGINSSIEGLDFIGNIEIESANTFTLETDEIISFSATFTPNDRGFLESEILLESDAKSRGIGSFVEAIHRYEKIKVRARSIEPVLTTDILDTLDFGVISGTKACLDASIQEFILRNTGSGDLEIINAFTTDLSIFDINIDTNFVAPDSQTTAKVNFLPGGNNIFRVYNQERLYIVTNMLPPNDTLVIPLKATFASPGETQFYIEDQSFFPGTRLKMPIIVDGERISLADRFSTTLTFDRTLLQFNELYTQGSASELAANTSFASTDGTGRLEISINVPQGENFAISDTLCFLEFDTFIGTSIASNMVFISPQFGDEDCNSLIDVDSRVGVISLDSLCFADQYVHGNQMSLEINGVHPLPTFDELVIDLGLGENENIKGILEVRNLRGETILRKERWLVSGENLLDVSMLLTGQYLLFISTQDQSDVIGFIKL